MALKNARGDVSAASTETIYTVPAGQTAQILYCCVTNVGDAATTFTLQWTDDSDSDEVTRWLNKRQLAQNGSLELAGLILEAGDSLQLVKDVAASELEISVAIDVN